MSRYQVTCPNCGQVKTVAPNTQYKCSGCNTTITVGNDGRIKKAVKYR